MSIEYKKEVLSLINDLTPINPSIIIEKTEDGIRIARDNAAHSIFYYLNAEKDSFNFEREKIAFYNFPEFYQLINVFNSPEISLKENKLKISKDKSKIKYIISDPETISESAAPKGIKFPSTDARLSFDVSEIKDLKKMISLLRSKYIKFIISGKSISVNCLNENHDNSYEKTFDMGEEFSETEDFEMKIASDIFTLIPENNYIFEICKGGITRFSYKKDNVDLTIFVAQVIDE